MILRPSQHSHSSPQGEGEGYLASSADLMIGLLFIFIIMVVYLATKTELPNSSPPPDPNKTLVKNVGFKLLHAGVQIQMDPESYVIALPADALFDKGLATPREGADATLQKTQEALKEVLPCYVKGKEMETSRCRKMNDQRVEIETIMIEGHTDSDQYPNDPDKNWHLGIDRARYVFEALQKGRIGQLTNSKGQALLGVSSYADTRPSKLTYELQDPKAKDRRVELRFILSYQADQGASRSSAELVNSVPKR